MILKHTHLITILTIISFPCVLPNLPTLQFNDPSPYYSASNNLMPANNQIVQLRKAYTKQVEPNQFYHLAINLSGFIQSANRARSCNGCGNYGGACDDWGDLGSQMGDFRGTIYAMGLFLGNSPNGNSIWANGIEDGNIENITGCSIGQTQLPPCLKDIASTLTGNSLCSSTVSPCPCSQDLDTALMFNPQAITDVTPSIFSIDYLDDDNTFFGAFSLPLKYKKAGFRFELGAEFGNHIAFTLQTGIANIKQTTTGLIPISACPLILPGCTTVTNTNGFNQITPGQPTTQLSTANNPVNTNYLYNSLNFRDSGGLVPPGIPNTTAQNVFNEQISENVQNIFGPCGLNISLCDFDDYSMEDVRVFLTFKNSYGLDRYTRHSTLDDDWFEMIFTPYAWIAASIPTAKCKDWSKLLSLPFGNNGHTSLGGAVGMTFDFREGLEVGVEGGLTHFFARNEYRPVPNHPLQRVIYPFSTNVNVKPGMNWHFKAMVNSYQFIEHISFWATYEMIEHMQDCYTVCDNPIVYKTDPTTGKTFQEHVFLPKQLSCCSDWKAQFLNFGLIFDIQPGLQMSFLWQQSLTPRNAYYPVTFMGSLTFLF